MHDTQWFQDIEALGERIADTAARIDAAIHTLLSDLRSFDLAGGWQDQGALNCALWLSWRTSISVGAAREKVRVAHALAELPLIDTALAKGEVSYSKVRALTRVATKENEGTLLEMARTGTASQLERIVSLYRQTRSGETPELDDRWVRSRVMQDGYVRIEAQLPADEAARVMETLRVSAETRDPADGLMQLVDEGTREDGEKNPVEVFVHIDAATLEGSVEGGSGISAESAPGKAWGRGKSCSYRNLSS